MYRSTVSVDGATFETLHLLAKAEHRSMGSEILAITEFYIMNNDFERSEPAQKTKDIVENEVTFKT